MRVTVKITEADIREAIKQWARGHGLPSKMTDTLKLTVDLTQNEHPVNIVGVVAKLSAEFTADTDHLTDGPYR